MSNQLPIADFYPEISNVIAHVFWCISLADWCAYYEDTPVTSEWIADLPVEMDTLERSVEIEYQRGAHAAAQALRVSGGDWFTVYPQIDVALQAPNGEVVTDIDVLDRVVEACLKFWGPESLAELDEDQLFGLVAASMGHGVEAPEDFDLFSGLLGTCGLDLLGFVHDNQ